jgi:hypothetical protein
MTYQPSEIADFLMMLVLGPVTLVVARRIAPITFWPVAVCIGLMFTGYAATIIEGFLLPDFFNLVEHLSYALAGIAFVWLLARVGTYLGDTKVSRS